MGPYDEGRFPAGLLRARQGVEQTPGVCASSGVGPAARPENRKHMRFLSVKPVGAWRNGGARALGVPGAYAV